VKKKEILAKCFVDWLSEGAVIACQALEMAMSLNVILSLSL